MQCLEVPNSFSLFKSCSYNIYQFYYGFRDLWSKVLKAWRKLFKKVVPEIQPIHSYLCTSLLWNIKAKCYLFWRNTEQDKVFDVTHSCFACQAKQFSLLFTALCILKNISKVSWTLLCFVIVCYWENKTATIICSTNRTCQPAGMQN